MNLRCIALVVLTALANLANAEDSPCPAPHQVFYPLAEVIEREGLALEFDFAQTTYPDYGSPAHVRQQRDTVLRALEGKSVAERDALLLGRLSWSTKGTLPLLSITAFPEAGLFDTYLDVLERNGLEQHAAALRIARTGFPIWNTTAEERYAQWSDGKGNILDPLLDTTLRAQSDAFLKAQPPLLDKAQALLEGDPSYPVYAAKLENVEAYDRHIYLMQQIGTCVPRYATPEQADTALAALPPILADLHVIDLFLLESGNGGMHQYIFNSAGMLAPQFADVLARWDLPEQEAAVRDAMAYFPAPYPRDTQRRRGIMQGFDRATDSALNDGTWISDDPAIWDAVEERAQAAGYWPQ
ncbi:DMP19 family protein [Roseovarius sp. 2305UL8-3]|uniref:DMP19 family protein n=1 Tax=Roseovarius conchicola TaxID=3121636 RepID=UPI00352799BF